jgi:branched-chain amino acid transport system substrate-binding protein
MPAEIAKGKSHLWLWLLLLSLLAGGGALWWSFPEWFQLREPVYLAFAGGLSGEDARDVETGLRGARLCVERINRQGGIAGRRVELLVFDDANDENRAKTVAEQIATQTRAVGVIGHYFSSTSMAAGALYRQHELPAISPTATHVEVTRGNPWYFRSVFNDALQGSFLAHYVKHVLRRPRVRVIHESEAYGAGLAESFGASATELGIQISWRRGFDSASPTLDADLAAIVEELAQADPLEVVFLAVQWNEGLKLIKAIRDAQLKLTLVTPDSMADDDFSAAFPDAPPERRDSYASGLYVSTPLIFDTASDEALRLRETYRQRYGDEPNWGTVFSHDAVLLLAEAARKALAQSGQAPLAEQRRRVREALASFDSPGRSIEGASGLNYFDAEGDVQKPISIGVYQKSMISALTQLQGVRNLGEIGNLSEDMENQRVVLVNGQYMHRTQVVYAGVTFRELSEPNIAERTYLLDFDLWFRYQGQFDSQAVEFLNVAEPVALGEPVQSSSHRGLEYRRYRVKGRFKADFARDFAQPGGGQQHLLGISFAHQTSNRYNLIYAVDSLGMGSPESWLDSALQRQLLSPVYGWLPVKALFFQNTLLRGMNGQPAYLNLPDGALPYSRFNAGLVVRKDEIQLDRLLPYRLALPGLPVALALLGLLVWLEQKRKACSRCLWMAEMFLILSILVAVEVILLEVFALQPASFQELLKNVFKVLWWLVPAFLFNRTVERFVWTPLEQRSQQKIPGLARGFAGAFIYLMALLGVVAFVFQQPITSLLATSSILLMIIGLAVQLNISNIFSGIALNLERPFRIGDPVELNNRQFGVLKGKVVDMNWRATHFKRDDNLIILPNTVVAESKIINFNYPDNLVKRGFVVRVSPEHPPEKVIEVLEGVLKAMPGIEEYVAGFMGIGEWAAEYWFEFHFRNYSKRHYYRDMLWQRAWHTLNQAGMPPVIQRDRLG